MDQQQRNPAPDQNQHKDSREQEKEPGQQSPRATEPDKRDQPDGEQRAVHERENQKQR
jgi:hypothetical protein